MIFEVITSKLTFKILSQKVSGKRHATEDFIRGLFICGFANSRSKTALRGKQLNLVH
jgi:hypothetical protein